MDIHTIKTPGLAHLSYVLVDGDEAAVIDPRIDVDDYLRIARDAEAVITLVVETHRHEDFLSGAHALAQRTGAEVIHGKGIDFAFGTSASHGDRFDIGSVQLRVLETPGHTPESISLAVLHTETSDDDAIGVFTGDALFVHDVGRTDLAPAGPESNARALHESLQRILALGDQAFVWPAHGAGSVCGNGMADRDQSTIGYERRNNPALQLDRDAFVQRKVEEHHDQPPYFRVMEALNLQGSPGLDAGAPRLVGPDDLGDCVVDVREPEAWAGCHLPGSLSLPVSLIASWAGWWLDHDRPISLVASDDGQAEQARAQLSRLGYTRVTRRLIGGPVRFQTTGQSLGSCDCVDVNELRQQLRAVMLLDVRKPEEWREDHVDGAVHIPLSELADRTGEVPRDRRVVTFCGSGRRATLAAALLARHGVNDVAICFGSMAAWRS